MKSTRMVESIKQSLRLKIGSEEISLFKVFSNEWIPLEKDSHHNMIHYDQKMPNIFTLKVPYFRC
jgi:hypothetical protein